MKWLSRLSQGKEVQHVASLCSGVDQWHAEICITEGLDGVYVGVYDHVNSVIMEVYIKEMEFEVIHRDGCYYHDFIQQKGE